MAKVSVVRYSISPHPSSATVALFWLALLVGCSRPPDRAARGESSAVADRELTPYRPLLRRVGVGDSAFEAQADLPYDSARALAGQTGGATASVGRVPGAPGRFLVVARGSESTSDDYGLRFHLLAARPTGLVVLDRSRGTLDSYVLRPVFFTGAGRTLLFGNTGAEGSWGLVVYELRGDSLRRLGDLDVAKMPADPSDPYEDPLPHARVFAEAAEGEGFQVQFDTDLVSVGSGDDDEPLRRSGGAPLRFRYRAGRFERAGNGP